MARAARCDLQPSWGKRLAFGTLLAVFVVAVVELLSYLAIAIALRAPIGLAPIQRQRGALAEAEIRTRVYREVRHRAAYGDEAVHPYLGFVDRAGGTDRRAGLAVDVPVPQRSARTLTVGITGGSVAGEFARQAGRVLAPRLRASPALADRDIAVVSLAKGGWKQPQQLIALAYLLAAGGELDVLINLDGFNEVALHDAENRAQGVFPAFPSNWAMRARPVPDPDVLPIAGRYAEVEAVRRRWARNFARWPLGGSALAGFAWLVRDRMLSAELFELQNALRTHVSAQTDYAWTGPQIAFASDDAIADELVAIWSRSSTQLDRLCRENGILYLHLLQPNQYVTGSKPMSAEERRIAWNDRTPFRPGAQRGYPRLVRACQHLAERGIPCHDLTQLFAGVREPLYVDDCCHFNERGYEQVGEYAARALLERFAIARRDDTDARSHPPVGPP